MEIYKQIFVTEYLNKVILKIRYIINKKIISFN